jgi:twitching motility protein PilT
VKTLQQMLRELARPEVSEFAVASDRLPCVKVGDKYEPVDDVAPTTDAILAMLVAVGGSRHVEDLETKPAAWATRIEGLGTVNVQAALRTGRAQARIVLAQRAPAQAAAPGPQAQPAPAAAHQPAPFVEPTRMAAVPTPAPVAATAPDVGPVVAPAQPRRQVDVAPAVSGGGSSALDGLLRGARDAAASDLHVIAERPVLMRTAGDLTPSGGPLAEANVEAMMMGIVPERLRATLAVEGSCDFAFDRPGLGRFRVNVSRQRTGLKGCFRCIPPAIPTLASLGLPLEIERATHHHQGLVLVTGPTGHGKTTTLAAIVDIINAGTTHHIITVEDPVEYVHPRKKAMMSQREVGTHTRTFAAALKGSLREDPDVIVVGELRDTETVRMALAASETGHLVLGTMNTPSAAKTIDRLVDLFPPADQQQVRMTLAGGLHLVVSQRLLPATDGRMAAAVELLPGSIALWSLIRDGKTYQIPSLQQRGKGFGIMRIDDSLADLVRAGRVTLPNALAVAEAPDELEAVLAGKRVPPPAPEAAKNKPEAGGLLGKAGQLFGGKKGP